MLLLVVDDVPAHMAHDPRVMPKTTRRVFSRGARLLQAYAHIPLCGPATAAIYSGKTWRGTGVDTNHASWRRFAASGSHLSTIATDLKAAGYRCGHFGKHMVGGRGRDRSVPPGYDRWVERVSGQDMNVDGRYPVRLRGGERFFAEEAARFVRRSAGSPWYASLFLTAGHSPYDPSAAHADDFAGSRFERPNVNEDTSDKPRWMRDLPPKDRERMGGANRHPFRGASWHRPWRRHIAAVPNRSISAAA